MDDDAESSFVAGFLVLIQQLESGNIRYIVDLI